jgi:copper chaperone CopZ
MKRLGAIAIETAFVTTAFISGKAWAAEPQIALTKASEPPPAQSANHYDKNALHRLDLRIVGKSCPVCLLGIQKKINALQGVVKAAVMLKKPYGVSVIYDSKQLQQAKILATIKSYEKNTFVDGVQDAAVAKVPLVLIPPFAKPEEGASP